MFGFMRPILTMRLFSRLFTSVRGDMTRKLCRTTRNSTSDESLSKIVGSIPIELGLVVERLSDRVLVEPQGMSSLHTPYVLCSQRSKVDSTSLVVGDFVKFQRHKTYNENISLMEQDVGVVGRALQVPHHVSVALVLPPILGVYEAPPALGGLLLPLQRGEKRPPVHVVGHAHAGHV